MRNTLAIAFRNNIVPTTAIAPPNYRSATGDFALSDKIACYNCKIARGCIKEVGLFHTDKVSDVIEYEDFLNNIRKLPVNVPRCDKIIETPLDDTILMCELTCCEEPYLSEHLRDGAIVPGKITKARRQLQDTITLLCDMPEIATKILMHNNRVSILAIRLKNGITQGRRGYSNQAQAAMGEFLRPTLAIANLRRSGDLPYGFDYVQLVYPTVFNY